MAKCVNSVTDWTKFNTTNEEIELPEDLLEKSGDDVNEGERILNRRLVGITDLILRIGNGLMTILNSGTLDEDRWDCGGIQMIVFEYLHKLNFTIRFVINEICTVNATSLAKHRYFTHFNSAVIQKLHDLVAIIGRLSDVNPNIYYEDHLKPMATDQSIFVHSLSSIWSLVIQLMHSFEAPGRNVIFKEQLASSSEDYMFLEEMDFIVASRRHARIFLMDLIGTSWIKFNQLVKLDHLIKSSPFLCPCAGRRFIETLDYALIGESGRAENIILELLNIISDIRAKPSLTTASIRRPDLIPLDGPLSREICECDPQTRAYFIIWHVYSLSQLILKRTAVVDHQNVGGSGGGHEASRPLTKESLLKMIGECEPMLASCLKIVLLESFISPIEDGARSNVKRPETRGVASSSTKPTFNKLSAHQEERFQLIIHMVDHLVEILPNNFKSLAIILLQLFADHWPSLGPCGTNYFDDCSFRIKFMTVFQLFTKIMNQLKENNESDVEQQEDKQLVELDSIWDRILSKIGDKPAVAAGGRASTSKQKIT